MTDDEAISRAREIYCDDDIEIDDFDVKTSKADEGIWGQAWVWVPSDEVEENELPEGSDE